MVGLPLIPNSSCTKSGARNTAVTTTSAKGISNSFHWIGTSLELPSRYGKMQQNLNANKARSRVSSHIPRLSMNDPCGPIPYTWGITALAASDRLLPSSATRILCVPFLSTTIVRTRRRPPHLLPASPQTPARKDNSLHSPGATERI